MRLTYPLAAVAAVALVVPAAATADHQSVRCAKHKAEVTKAQAKRGQVTRKACIRQWKRNHMEWPPNPEWWEIRRRVGTYNWHKAERVANCETGGTRGAHPTRGNLNWHLTGEYQGPLGMWRGTAAYGKRATGYWGPKLTWQEWVAVAVSAHPITKGWSGWSCRGA